MRDCYGMRKPAPAERSCYSELLLGEAIREVLNNDAIKKKSLVI